MIIIYLKQAWQMLRENPLVSTISVAGTALSIAMVMVVVLIYQIRLANYAPEKHRDRMLYVYATQAASKAGKGRNNGYMSAEVVKECFYTLETPEAITAVAQSDLPVSVPSKRLYKEYKIKSVDTGFWKVFDFNFLQGEAFTEADFNSGLRKVVVSDRLARDIFGRTDIIGETVVMSFKPYTVCGVVKEVSNAAADAHAHVWRPYTSEESLLSSSTSYGEGIVGNFQVLLLAERRSDFEKIKAELERRTEQYNSGKSDFNVGFLSGPLTRFDIAMGANGFGNFDRKPVLVRIGLLLGFLLLVPALNLTGVVQSSVKRRRSEIGVRKAFGATSDRLLNQVLSENLLTTLIGGVIGFGLSYLFLIACKSFLLPQEPLLNADMLFQPVTFGLALLITLLMNLLSAFVPAARTVRQQVTEALREIEN
ncbi:MAG: ABC transporter permease [Tannerellaceae bacterium]|jgi:putative ABC transport system permease protein|nr:ABC transporter permease [Tannerellaceae bacterium]